MRIIQAVRSTAAWTLGVTRQALLTAMLVFSAGAFMGTPLRAIWPVTDLTHTIATLVFSGEQGANMIESLAQGAMQLKKWEEELKYWGKQAEMFASVYSACKDWQSLGYEGIAGLFMNEWFDDIPGIEGVRGMLVAGELTLEELKAIYKKVDYMMQMMNDPIVRSCAGLTARGDLCANFYQKVVESRVALAATDKRAQKEDRAIRDKMNAVMGRIKVLSETQNASLPALYALQAELTLLENKLNLTHAQSNQVKAEIERKARQDREELVSGVDAATKQAVTERRNGASGVLALATGGKN